MLSKATEKRRRGYELESRNTLSTTNLPTTHDNACLFAVAIIYRRIESIINRRNVTMMQHVKRVMVDFTEEQWTVMEQFKGVLRNSDSEIVRSLFWPTFRKNPT